MGTVLHPNAKTTPRVRKMGQGKKWIEEFQIENFKGFENLSLKGLTNLNLFVGPNNIGKTSVLEAFAMASGFYPRVLLSNFLRKLRQEKLEVVDDFLMFFSNYEDKKPISLCTIFKDTDLGSIYFRAEYQKALDQPKLACELSSKKHTNKFIRWEVYEDEPKGHLQKTSSDPLAQVLEIALQQRQKAFISDFKKRPISDYYEFGDDYSPIVCFIHRGFRLDKGERDLIQAKSTNQKVLAFAQKIDPRIEGLSVNDDLVFLYLPNIDKPLPINHLGTGFIKVLKLYLAIMTNGIDAILFDEITDGLHPDTIQILIEHLLPELVKHNIQLFATTHSYDILRCIANYNGDHTASIAVYNLYRHEEKSLVHRYDCDGVGRFLEDVRN